MDKDHECYKLYFRLKKSGQEVPEKVHEGYKRHRMAKHAANPEHRRQLDMERYYTNHEQMLEKAKVYRETEQRKQYMKEFRASETGMKSMRITHWRQSGVKHDNFDELYDIWKAATNCADCDVNLIEGNIGSNHKCLDHDHTTGLFRDIVCHKCNVHRGIADSLSALNL